MTVAQRSDYYAKISDDYGCKTQLHGAHGLTKLRNGVKLFPAFCVALFKFLGKNTKLILLTTFVILVFILTRKFKRISEYNPSLADGHSRTPQSGGGLPPVNDPKFPGFSSARSPAYDDETIPMVSVHPSDSDGAAEGRPLVDPSAKDSEESRSDSSVGEDPEKSSSTSEKSEIKNSEQELSGNEDPAKSDQNLGEKSLDAKQDSEDRNKNDAQDNLDSENENNEQGQIVSEKDEENENLEKTEMKENEEKEEKTTNVTLCPLLDLNSRGPIKLELDNISSIEEQEKHHPELLPGGRYRPPHCKARQTTAIIVPFRNREHHLPVLLHNLHPFLQRQQTEYGIYIINQEDDFPFNRGMLLDVGFKEALKDFHYECFIFHDVDMLPEDDRIVYNCSEESPIHLAHVTSKLNYKLPYATMFGGVNAITRKQFTILNGFATCYWGWGKEDDDMWARIRQHGFKVSRLPEGIARFKSLDHQNEPRNKNREKIFEHVQKKSLTIGLNNLQYNIKEIKRTQLFTWISVSLIHGSDEMPDL